MTMAPPPTPGIPRVPIWGQECSKASCTTSTVPRCAAAAAFKMRVPVPALSSLSTDLTAGSGVSADVAPLPSLLEESAATHFHPCGSSGLGVFRNSGLGADGSMLSNRMTAHDVSMQESNFELLRQLVQREATGLSAGHLHLPGSFQGGAHGSASNALGDRSQFTQQLPGSFPSGDCWPRTRALFPYLSAADISSVPSFQDVSYGLPTTAASMVGMAPDVGCEGPSFGLPLQGNQRLITSLLTSLAPGAERLASGATQKRLKMGTGLGRVASLASSAAVHRRDAPLEASMDGSQAPASSSVGAVGGAPCLEGQLSFEEGALRRGGEKAWASVAEKRAGSEEGKGGGSEEGKGGGSEEERKERRKASNRDAARRMRRRHSDRVAELQAQISDLRGSHDAVLEQLQAAQDTIKRLELTNKRLEEQISCRSTPAFENTKKDRDVAPQAGTGCDAVCVGEKRGRDEDEASQLLEANVGQISLDLGWEESESNVDEYPAVHLFGIDERELEDIFTLLE